MEYDNLIVVRNNSFHDRFIVIDNKEIYIVGTSFNSIGDNITTIVRLDDKKAKELLINSINGIINKKDYLF